jgi:DNA-binding PadR family transcriptional regulator
MTNAELAVLSLIAEKPRHGYEVEQEIEARGMREWTEVGFSSIYYILKKLEREGFISSRKEQHEGRGPARVVYRTTANGRRRLERELLRALSQPTRCYSPLQIGLANLPSLPNQEAVDGLKRYRDELEARQAHVQARRASQAPLPWFVEAMFEHSLTMIRAESSWVRDFLKKMEAQGGKS